MQPFRREFDVGNLAMWDHEHPGNAIRPLFDRWALPGERGSSARPLRVGIRAGYLNLYMKGQSVAKLSSGRAGPSIDVHEAYTSGPAEGSRSAGQQYVKFDADKLASAETTALIAGWITAAERHASAEKRFVDDLIGDNPGVIDLEMGLPAGDEPGGDRVAPRMDLVVAQVDGETASIAFWEAKCANNSELRRSGDAAPKVLGQLERYRRWMTADRVAEVRQAYRETAGVLRGLQILFRSDATSPCLATWRALKAANAPAVIVQPGIVIGNYWPKGSAEAIADGRMAQAAASFARNGHRDKIARAGVTVHEVGPDDGNLTLPHLSLVAPI